MSGVYIAGMQKPEKCDECPLQTADMICELSTCPLIPVPDHGRLIDADALRELAIKRIDTAISEQASAKRDSKEYHMAVGSIGMAFRCRLDVDEFPTIIPADKKDPEP